MLFILPLKWVMPFFPSAGLVDTPDLIVDEIPASTSNQRKNPGYLPGVLTGVALVLIALLIVSVLVYRR